MVAGLLSYAFFVIATRSLGAAAAAPVSVLWSYWAIAAALLTFAVQHWTIRTVTHDGHEGTVARSLPRIAAAAVVLAVITGALAYLARYPLFGTGDVAFPLLVGAVTIGAVFLGLLRGALASRKRYLATGISFVTEMVCRVLAAATVALAGGGAVAFGVALAVGPLANLVWWRALRFTSHDAGAGVVRNPLALAAGIAGGSLIAQVVLTSAPVLLAAMGDAPAEVTALFVALAVWRAPYMVFLGMATTLTSMLTNFVKRRQFGRLAQVHWGTAAFVLCGVLLAGLIGATIFGPMLRLAFGSDIRLPVWAMVATGAGTVVAVGNLVLLLTLLAYGRSGRTTVAWVGALVVTAGWLVAAPLGVLDTVVTAFVLAQVVAFAGQLWFGWRARRDLAMEAGSPDHHPSATPLPGG